MKINHHISLDDNVTYLLSKILQRENQIMATMQDVLAAVQNESDLEDGVITMLDQVVQQLKDAQAQNDPTAIQAVVDKINANKQKLADAVTRNTPAQTTDQAQTPAPQATV